MAIEKLDVFADEEGSIVIVVTFNSTPLTFNWTLRESISEDVINGRTAVVETPTNPTNIVLSGDDLAIPVSTDPERVVTIWGTYNSVTYGSGLKYTRSIGFVIEDYIGIPTS